MFSGIKNWFSKSSKNKESLCSETSIMSNLAMNKRCKKSKPNSSKKEEYDTEKNELLNILLAIESEGYWKFS